MISYYSFLDESDSEITYYKLSQTDIDGKVTECGIISVYTPHPDDSQDDIIYYDILGRVVNYKTRYFMIYSRY